MLRRSIASRNEPHGSGQKPNHRAHPERRTPTIMHHDVSDQRRGKPSPGADACKYPAIGNTALADWNPARDELIGRRINYGLAGPERETDRNKQEESARYLRWNQRR